MPILLKNGSPMKQVLFALCLSPLATVAFAQESMTNWSGGYAGVQFGHLKSDLDIDYEEDNGSTGFKSTASANASGAIAGLYGGYNWQRTGPWVYGIEGEINWADANANAREVVVVTPPLFPDPVLGEYKAEISATAAIRARIGYANKRDLFYGAIGLAYIGYESTYENPSPAVPSRNQTGRSTGWSLGGGWERDFGNQWVGRIDYSYSDFGSDTIGSDTFENGNGFVFSGKDHTSEIRVGIARRF